MDAYVDKAPVSLPAEAHPYTPRTEKKLRALPKPEPCIIPPQGTRPFFCGRTRHLPERNLALVTTLGSRSQSEQEGTELPAPRNCWGERRPVSVYACSRLCACLPFSPAFLCKIWPLVSLQQVRSALSQLTTACLSLEWSGVHHFLL